MRPHHLSMVDATSLREMLPGAQRLPPDLVDAIARRASLQTVGESTALLRQRAVVDRLVVLVDGQVSTYVHFTGAGDLVVETTAQPGRVFGWSGLRRPNRATATVRTDTPCTVLTIPIDVIYSGPPRWTSEVCRMVAAALADRATELSRSAVEGGHGDGTADA